MADGPLSGVRILDLTHVWSGPLGTRILSDLGAEIVKVEAPYRRGPREPVYTPIGGWIGGEPADEPWNRNAVFVKQARNSKSVCLDLKSEAGHATFLELVATADVIVENFSARAMPSLGLDYGALQHANPDIIYLTMPGYGTYGPYSDWVAFGPSVEPMSGLAQVMGYDKGEPFTSAMALVDPIAGVSLASAVLTALLRRQRTGKGGMVEMSLHEAGVTYSGPWLIEHQLGGVVEPTGNRHPAMAPHGIYPCKDEDKWIAIACRTDTDWRSLCSIVGENLNPSADLSARRLNEEEIDATIASWTRQRDRNEAAEELQRAGIPAGPVNNAPDMIADSQVQHRSFFVPLERFDTLIPGTPVKMRGSSVESWTPCPDLGADNARVLRDWLGYSDERISDLEDKGVLANKPPA